ncbi:rhomboid family protein [Colletotrichum scovillei]|uniref:Rhomboid family protein n=1 Tax=Colletotrichum scovillei TaxID=1209932 RepID=A0A9P7R5W8_9PEZI|nr:rhomboid family protein [Colletotrichum scovillei]KAF4781925.1 rhomboid family protein [Colletotrichum scovillei]KAG7050776.1 rhomboid family protein [Colletotrichum scovillei]KAG7069820.1 rhomboid family protein [Colletotrichum scovillei]KAG7073735.1 rhomboid family protein [Colletotrichum scovillei]
MNASFGLVSSRSFLHPGLRAAYRSAPNTTSCSPASRLLSICTIITSRTPAATRSYIPGPSSLRQTQWPSPSLTAITAGKSTQRWASSSSASSPPPKTDYKNEPLLREYVDLPLDYKDKHGLRFREENKDLTAAEVRAVFGPSLKPAAANRLLRIMHGRRVAGTLEDPAFAVNTAAFTAQQRDAALAYLREKTPVDEVLNAGLRAEDELAALEKDLAEEEESSADEGDAASSTAGSKTPSLRKETPVVKPDPVYGYSAFDAIRAKNQAKAAEEEARLIAEAEAKGIEYNPGTLSIPIKRPPMTPRMAKWTEQGAASDLAAPPPLTFAERILPSAAVVLLLVASLAAFAAVYTPPRDADRLFPEVSASTATVGALIALNVLVSVAWRVPPLWRFLNRYFVLVHGMPRAVTMITANFSHSSLGHLATNMVGLWFMGTALHDEVGRANFLAIYLASGAVGFLGSLTAFTLRGLLTVSTVGASGAVFGVATAYFWMHRFDSFKVLGFPPDPMNGPQGLGFIALILGFHIYAFFRRGKQTIDLTSHLFGMLTGLVGIEFVTGRKAEGVRVDGLEKKKARGDLVADAPPRDGQGDGGNDVKA